MTLRSTVYDFPVGTSPFTGLTYTLTLDNDLADDYFVLVQGAGGQNRTVAHSLARVTDDPLGNFGTVTLDPDEIELTRLAATDEWAGTVTVIECLDDQDASGFTLLDVLEPSQAANVNSSTATSGTAWSDIDQVVPFGGYRGGGATCDGTTTDYGHGLARFAPSSTDTIDIDRDAAEDGTAADWTVYVVEWGSEWTVQRASFSGATSVEPTYATTALGTSVDPSTSWLWGCSTSNDNGIGDSGYGTIMTLGDGSDADTASSVSTAAIAARYADARDAECYVMTHPQLAVTWAYTEDENGLTADLTVDAVTEAFAFVTNTCAGTGTAYPRPLWWPYYLTSTSVRCERTYSGQLSELWLQSIDTSAVGDTEPTDYVLAYNLDEGSGSDVANSGTAGADWDMTTAGNPTWETGPGNYPPFDDDYLEVDGAGDEAAVSGQSASDLWPTSDRSLTMAVLAYATSEVEGTTFAIGQINDGVHIQFWSDGMIYAGLVVGGDYQEGEEPYSLDTWYKVVLTIEDDSGGTGNYYVTLYVDDVEVFGLSTTLFPDDADLDQASIGGYNGGQYLDGGVAATRFYPRLLTAAERAGLFTPDDSAITGALDVTLDDVTSTATGTQAHTGTTAVTLEDVSLSAAGVQGHDGTLAVDLDDTTLTAAAAQGHDGAVAATLDDVTLSAAGGQAHDGTVAAALDDTTLSATVAQGHAGTVAATLDDATLAATGASGASGSVDATLDDATLAAAGGQGNAGAVAVTLDDATLAAAGVQGHVGDLAATLDDAALAAQAGQAHTGAAAVDLDDATLAAAAVQGHDGSVAATLDDAQLTAAGASGDAGAVNVTLDDTTLSAAGVQGHDGTVAVDLDPTTLAAQGAQAHTGSLAATLDDAALSAAGSSGDAAALNVTLDDTTLTAAGGQGHAGQVDATLDDVALSAVAGHYYEGAVDATLDDVALAAQAGQGHDGALAQTLDDATLAASAVQGHTGSVAVDLDDTTLAAGSTSAVEGEADVTLDSTTLAATGAVAHTGSVDATLADTTLAASAVQGNDGALAVTLDDATLAAVAPATGSVAATLDDVTLSAAGAALVEASLEVTLDDVTLAATGALGAVGALAVDLDATTLAAVGTSTRVIPNAPQVALAGTTTPLAPGEAATPTAVGDTATPTATGRADVPTAAGRAGQPTVTRH